MAAGVLLTDVSSTFAENYLLPRLNKHESVRISFQKESERVVSTISKKDKKSFNHESYQRLSSSLAELWNSHMGKLPMLEFTQQLLRVADCLYSSGLYQLARTQGYRRCLIDAGLQSPVEGGTGFTTTQAITKYVFNCDSEPMILAILRAEIGDAMCIYFTTEEKDTRLLHRSTKSIILSTLSRLRCVSQGALAREDRYWLAHNAFLLSLTICQKMMSYGHVLPIIEYLVWCVICMECSVPLMALKYLPLRVNFYIAVCQSYHFIWKPVQAEIFARRALDKVHELAKFEAMSGSEASPASKLIYKEATVKLGILIFKRSIFESRKKIKIPFKLKFRSNMKDILSLPPPRCPTEKLLSEMCPGASAQLLAIIETVTSPTRRTLHPAPAPVIDIDMDMISDVYLELFTVGVAICQKALDSKYSGATYTSLMDSAIHGGNYIPLESMVRFLCLSYFSKRRDAIDMLANKVIKAIQKSSDQQAIIKGKLLQLLLELDVFLFAHKRVVQGSSTQVAPSINVSGVEVGTSQPSNETTIYSSSEEQLEALVKMTRLISSVIHSSPSLVTTDFDILLDCAVVCWEVVNPALSQITSHDYQVCTAFIQNSSGARYMEVLIELIFIFETLELWRLDPLLHGEMCLKLCCLQEAKADRSSPPDPLALFLSYDRCQLLACQAELEKSLHCLEIARQSISIGGDTLQSESTGGKTSDLMVLHAEFVYSLIRVQVKLASTIPPPAVSEFKEKAVSSLKSKVKERKEKQAERESLLSQITSPGVDIPDLIQLRAACGKNHYSLGLLSMLEATSFPGLDQEKKKMLMKESYNHLLQEQQQQNQHLTDSSHTTRNPPTKEAASQQPPPLLVHSSATSMEFIPQSPVSPPSQPIAYYKLFGREAAGSNVKVRLVDKHFSGLGIEVPAEPNCKLIVRNLKPNEAYVFAVAAYSSQGELIDKAIGQTSRPFIAAYSLPLLTAWGYCCQSAFLSGVTSIAMKSSKILWDHFVFDSDSDGVNADSDKFVYYQLNKSIISSSLSTHLRQFVSSILISVHLSLIQSGLLMNQVSTRGLLLPNQLERIELVRKLLVALEVAGMVNDAHLCLQIVIKCYGLLAPLLQHGIGSWPPLFEVLLHCYTVLTELPDNVISTPHIPVTSAIHHMIAVISYNVGKVVLSKGNRVASSHFGNVTKYLLYQTLPGAYKLDIDHTINKGSLSFNAINSPTPTFVSSAAGSSVYITSPKKSKKKGNRFKKSLENIPDEMKSVQYKAMEAFLLRFNNNLTDEFELHGGENPILLHAVIANLSSVQAHKEVHKFRRRPPYLEILVHLLNSSLMKGYVDKVMEWIQEAFQWLSRRNDLLLTSRLAPNQAKHSDTQRSRMKFNKMSRAMSPFLGSTNTRTSVKSGRVSPTGSTVSKQPGSPRSGSPRPGSPRAQSPTGSINSKRPLSAGGSTNSKRPQSGSSGTTSGKSAASGGTAGTSRREASQSTTTKRFTTKRALAFINQAAELSQKVKITKDDLEFKSCMILVTSLPEMWLNYRNRLPHRKRLQTASSDELPWRSQANLIMATCYHSQILGHLAEFMREQIFEREEGKCVDEGLRFDSVGTIIEGAIPQFLPALAGQGNKCLTTPKLHALVTGEFHRINSAQVYSQRAATYARSPQTVIFEEMRFLMTHFQRAAVLALRGSHWILLQNVARSLLNAINSLVLAISKLKKKPSALNLAALYGIACRPLYHIADALIDLIVEHDIGSIPQVASLRFTNHLDDANEVNVAVIRRVVFLAVHTLHAHNHWEKVISLCLRFDNATRHSFVDQLVPVICSAQVKLLERISVESHSKDKPSTPVNDPGIKGQNLYGTVGHSLFLVPKELMNAAGVAERIKLIEKTGKHAKSKCHRVLMQCRRYLQGYIASLRQPELGYIQEMQSCSGGTDTMGLGKTDLATFKKCKLPFVIESYEKAVQTFEKHREKSCTVQAMNELGNVFLISGNFRLAGEWWLNGLSLMLKVDNPLFSWRKISPAGLKGCGLWECLLGAWMGAKLLKYVYNRQLDIRLECALLSSSLLKAALAYSLPSPPSDMAYATLDLPHFIGEGGPFPFPGVDLFSDLFRFSPSHLLSTLSWCSEELVTRGYALKALPILWFYQHVASSICRSVEQVVRAKILRLRALTELSFFNLALYELHLILSGIDLPQEIVHWPQPPEVPWTLGKFQDDLPITSSGNHKVIVNLIERPLRPRLEMLYGTLNTTNLTLARAKLYMALACTQSTTPLPPPVQPPSSPPNPSQSGADATPNVSNSNSRLTSSAERRTATRSVLLHATEKILTILCQQLEEDTDGECADVRVEALLELARMTLIFQRSINSYQISLQALRLLQILETKRPEKLRELDIRLWFQCRSLMIHSVVGLEGKPGGETVLLEVGELGAECEKIGDVELAAEIEFAAAEHALSLLPCQLQAAIQHSQRCVELLNSLEELSHRGQLLSFKASLLLADTTSIQATEHDTGSEDGKTLVHQQMIEVFDGLMRNIKKQLDNEQLSINIHKPHRLILASCLLRQGHTYILLGSAEKEMEGRDICFQKAQKCFHEGLQVLNNSSHSDGSLLAELLVANGWALSLAANGYKLDESISSLLLGRKIVNNTTNYKLATTLFLTLAEVSNKRCKQSSIFKAVSQESGISATSELTDLKLELERERGKEKAYAWSMIRLALRTSTAQQSLRGLVSATRDESMTAPLPLRALKDLPDFLLLELCSNNNDILLTLNSKLVVLPVESLLQTTLVAQVKKANVELSWFSIISWYYRLLQRCYWQKASLKLTDSAWGLNHHSVTPALHRKCKATLHFLTTHCPQFKSCLIPRNILHFSVTGHTGPCENLASETEVTVLWCKNSFSSSPEMAISDRITCYIAANSRTVTSPTHFTAQQLGLETHILHTSLEKLTKLHETWKALAKEAQDFMDIKANLLPISRSPAKQRKSEKSLQPPDVLVQGITKALKQTARLFKLKTKNLPRLEVYTVPDLVRTMEPFILAGFKGNPYHFFKELLFTKQELLS